jgi:DNA-directed RNA polymerase sigma subunit (sigma70/sigma32)
MPNNIDIPRSEWERLIDEWIFNERDRAILKRRLLDGKTFEQLAEEFDLSTQNIQRIVYKSQNKLFFKI